MSPAGKQSDGLIRLANSYLKDGNTRKAKDALDRIPDDGSDASAEKWYQQAEIARTANDEGALSNILEHMRSSYAEVAVAGVGACSAPATCTCCARTTTALSITTARFTSAFPRAIRPRTRTGSAPG